MIKEKTLKAILLILLVLLFLPALCLAAAPALAEEEDFSAIEGDWFTEEIMMTVTDDGHFVLGWNDGDWTGSLKPERRVNEDGDEYIAYRMILEDPKDAAKIRAAIKKAILTRYVIKDLHDVPAIARQAVEALISRWADIKMVYRIRESHREDGA